MNKNFQFSIFNFLISVSFLTISFLLFPLVVKAAALYLLPSSQTVYQGETFIVEARLDTEGEEINAVGAAIEFSPDVLDVVDYSKGGSILNLWPEEPNIGQGKISFVGGTPKGFSGEGSIIKITFLSKEVGKSEVGFRGDSKVLLNDGMGTETKLSLLEGDYEIIERPKDLPQITSRSHPDQNKWHNKNTFHLHWDLIEGAEYSFILSRNPLIEPDDIPDEPEGDLIWMGDMEYANLEDGIYYFHLRQKLPGGDWSKKISFRAMVDVTIPEKFSLKIGRDPAMHGGKYFVSFSTTDETSGIDHYELKEGERDFKEIESPYVLEDQSLQSKIIVKAIDKAGNERVSEITPPRKPFPYWTIVFIFVVAIVIWRIIIKKSKKAKSKSFDLQNE